jgi:hypothetical protein
MTNKKKWKMKNRIKQYTCVYMMIILVSCSNEEKKINRIGVKEYTMELLPYKTFSLDENTTQATGYIQVFEIDDTARFTMFNPTKYNILIYDIASGNMIYEVSLFREGPDNVGKSIEGYYLSTLDSIYLYDYWESVLILVDRNGKIINKYNISDKLLQSTEDCVIPPYPYPRSDAPIRMVKDNIILQGMNGRKQECKNPTYMVTALYNIKTGSIIFANPYPEVYGDHSEISSWGVFSYREVFYDVNNQDEMIVSFPADDHIYVYDISSGNTKKFFAGYSDKDHISPLYNKTRYGDLVHYLEQTQYVGVFFDKYKNLYYRLVAHPLYDYDVNNRSTWSKKISVIILDSHFNKVGEYDVLEYTNQYSNTFVSEEGLHINVESEDDDYLKFISLKPVKL